MSDTLTPERIAELRTRREMCWSGHHPEYIALLDAAEERATLRAERDVALAENARLRDLLARVQVEERWRPIETAPKDGTRVILWHALWTNAEAAYAVNSPNVGIIWKLVACDYLVGIPPTHWRPLPLTPAEEAELDALRKQVAMEGETP